MQGDLERTLYNEEIILICPDGLNVTNSVVSTIFAVPFNGTITHFSCGYGTEGQSSALTAVTLYRGAVALIALGAVGTAATIVSSGAVAVKVVKGEALNIKVTTSTSTTDDYVGLTYQIRLRHALSTD